MNRLLAIILLLTFVSCKQKIKIDSKRISSNLDKQYFFGFEDKAIIDSNLIIPDSTQRYNGRVQMNILERYFVSDSSMCFKNENATYIKAQYDLQYDTQEFKSNYFLIILNNYNDFEYKFRYLENPDCVTCFPIKTLIGKRLILNKSEYKINDTVKGKLLLKYYVDNQCVRDSVDRFKIRVDSILFKYRLYQGSMTSINDFKKDFDK